MPPAHTYLPASVTQQHIRFFVREIWPRIRVRAASSKLGLFVSIR